MPLTFLLIGDGFIAQRHKDAIKSIGGKIIEIVTDQPNPDYWKEAIVKSPATWVVILTPNYLHYPMCRLAAESGKKVLCEKPLYINSGDVKKLANYPSIFTVLQLHHHPLVKKLKKEILPDKNYEIDMNISVYRDPNYYSSWKGDQARSGGLLFNLGIHYFDLLIYLFSEPTIINGAIGDEKTKSGILKGKNYTCRWRISSAAPRNLQQRTFAINGIDYNLSSQDNLSYEDLHKEVYKDLLRDIGATPVDVLPSTILIEKLYNNPVR